MSFFVLLISCSSIPLQGFLVQRKSILFVLRDTHRNMVNQRPDDDDDTAITAALSEEEEEKRSEEEKHHVPYLSGPGVVSHCFDNRDIVISNNEVDKCK